MATPFVTLSVSLLLWLSDMGGAAADPSGFVCVVVSLTLELTVSEPFSECEVVSLCAPAAVVVLVSVSPSESVPVVVMNSLRFDVALMPVVGSVIEIDPRSRSVTVALPVLCAWKASVSAPLEASVFPSESPSVPESSSVTISCTLTVAPERRSPTCQ